MGAVLGQSGDRKGVSALYDFRDSETWQIYVTLAVRALGSQARGWQARAEPQEEEEMRQAMGDLLHPKVGGGLLLTSGLP